MFLLQALRRACARYLAPARTQLLRCDPDAISFPPGNHLPDISSQQTSDALSLAAQHLNSLNVVVFPTETVYGLGALALKSDASAKIFSTKGRPADNPLIVHVSSFTMLQTLLPPGYTMSPAYQALTKHFWPGALTLLFPRDPHIIPNIITAGQATVAIRMPSHPVARALIAVTNGPLAAPSANTSGKPSPTKAEHVLRDLDGKIPLILDGGPCDVGLESTVVDGLHADGNIRVLRPGGITVEEIERVLKLELAGGKEDTDIVIPKVLVHRRDYRDEAMEQAPTTPGMKYRHYSPSVPVTLLHTSTQPPDGQDSISVTSFFASLHSASGAKAKVGVLASTDSKIWEHVKVEDGVKWHKYTLGPVAEPAVAAQRLFDGLLTLEQEGVDLILIEEILEEREGLAVMNRVRKAVGESRWIDFNSCE
ncbi:translation factor [Macrolepiota fuliginosa MF-IS2]|uniref:Threonylcarbamoyl-AMP synthase n=1 Tax=Macrolepiota fuliginosa MF-IS2 TaxID=1400762 RepID=A0A9P6C538_9AGAR|nr:translation factor [Macrolepiota fuliginosa MF-IS2]